MQRLHFTLVAVRTPRPTTIWTIGEQTVPDDNTNLDDDFFAELNADSATDEVAPFTSAGSENVSDDPFSSLEGFSEGNDPFGDAEAALAQEAAPVVDEVVGKKGKGKKAKKEKAPKEPKVKKEKIKKEKNIYYRYQFMKII